jgi:hypothetical protein
VRSAFANFLTLLVLWVVIDLVNHLLSPCHVFIFAGGLFVVYSALNLPLGAGLAAVFGVGLVCDANAPVPFGTHALLFATVHIILFRMRDRLPHEGTFGRIAVALLANFVLFAALSLLRARHASNAVWPRLATDFIFSQFFLGLIAPWFFALQKRTVARGLTGAYP